jgi:membrane-associated phospholipid phosphatase
MRHDFKTPLVGALACIGGLAALAYGAYSVGPVERLDLRIFLHFTDEDSRATGPAELLVHLGDLGPLLALMAAIVVFGLYFGRRREIIAAIAVIIGANLTTQLLKVALEHPRHTIHQGVTHAFWAELLPSADAFPSGHTTAAASVAVALLFVVPHRHQMTALAAGILLTAAVAVSVVVLTWHYPSDAVGAVLVAAIWGFLMAAALRPPERHGRTERRQTTAMRGLPSPPTIGGHGTRSWSHD